MTRSLVDRLRALPAEDRRAILSSLTARDVAALQWAWRDFWARPDVRDPAEPRTGTGQLPPPGPWQWWASIGGRGSGKTRTCAEWITDEAMRLGSGAVFHLVGASIDDARATMIEGPSGLLATSRPWAKPDFRSSVEGGVIEWPSGARGRVFGADKPRKGRGPQCNRMWLDDPAAFGPHGKETLDQLLFGFRLIAPDGSGPRGVISSTPIDTDLLRWILGGETGERQSAIVYSRSATDDNRANLAEDFFRQTLAEFAGTELEQQERFGIYVATAGKVFQGIDFSQPPIRVDCIPQDIACFAVWVDPATSSATHSCEVGIVVVALDRQGHVYAVEDLSRVMGADTWPSVVLDAVERWAPAAPCHVGIEINKGGNMGPELVKSAERIRTLQSGSPGKVGEIKTETATKGKAQRASPLVRLFRSGYLHLMPGLTTLERQLRDLDDNEGPKRDRADAFVWAVLDVSAAPAVVPWTSTCGIGGVKGRYGDADPRAPIGDADPRRSHDPRGRGGWGRYSP